MARLDLYAIYLFLHAELPENLRKLFCYFLILNALFLIFPASKPAGFLFSRFF